MLHPSAFFLKFFLNESNQKIILVLSFATYFLVVYELFPYLIFEGDNFLYALILPLVGLGLGLSYKKIPLQIFSSKNISTKEKKRHVDSVENDSIENMVESYSESDKTIVSDGTIGNSEIEAMLAKTNSEQPGEEKSDIESLLAGMGSNTNTSNDQNIDTHLIIMEKIEPLENTMNTLKMDFDQFKQDLTMVKEEVDALSSSFESTMTEIKCITTDFNNPLNFMTNDTIKNNIQTINIDQLKQQPIKEPIPVESIKEPIPVESIKEPIPVVEIENIPYEIMTIIDELSTDFSPKEIYELTKIHCKTSKIQYDEKQLKSFIDNKNNLKKSDIKKSDSSDLLFLNEAS